MSDDSCESSSVRAGTQSGKRTHLSTGVSTTSMCWIVCWWPASLASLLANLCCWVYHWSLEKNRASVATPWLLIFHKYVHPEESKGRLLVETSTLFPSRLSQLTFPSCQQARISEPSDHLIGEDNVDGGWLSQEGVQWCCCLVWND